MSVKILFLVSILSQFGVFSIPLNSKFLLPKNIGRIVGGIETTIEKFPYQVGITFLGGFHCGGAILRRNVVVTAADCVHNFPPTLLSVFAGTSSRIQGGVRSDIEKFIVHENYDIQTKDFNIALVILEEPFDFTESVQPINLPGKDEKIPAGSKTIIAGWGILEETGFLPVMIHTASVTIMDKAKCQKDFEGILFISPTMLCATGSAYGGTDPCIGDYGSPIVASGKIYGIVSSSDTCSKRAKLRIYTDVAYLRRWIDEKLGK